ncbi:MAG: PorP/SprF family type IX secretion system membrane protein [Bacteroidales bacterium]|nr:PorP/SprF family type IX secretion system membrane protein [Bacteroidales bacterium]
MSKKGVMLQSAGYFPIVFYMFCCFCNVNAQVTNKNYPVQFSQFIFSYPLVNPSSIGVNDNNEVVAGYQKPVTGFTGISTYFCNISFVPYRISPDAINRSIVGFRFFNDNEGAYINRSRFYAMYAFHTRVTGRLMFSGGVDFGGMNFSVKATPTTEGSSVFKVDANTGLWLYNDDFHVGISVNQLFRSVFQPLDEKTVLPTHFNITASYAVVKGEDVIIRPHILVTLPYYNTTSIRAVLYGLFFGKIISVVGWNRRTSMSAMLGINDLNLYGSSLDLTLSYITTLQKAAIGINTMEISLSYSF